MPRWVPVMPSLASLPVFADARVRPPITVAAVLKAMQTQARVIWALMLRETISRYGDYKIGFLWAFIEPLLTVAVLVGIFSTMRSGGPGGMELIPFMLTGICSFGLFKDPLTQMQTAISQSKNMLAFPQVTTFDVLTSRALMEVTIASFVLAFMLGMAHLIGWESDVENPLALLAALGLLATLGVGFGFLFASLEPIIPSIKQVSSLLMGRPLFLSSGLFFTAESIPAQVREYVLFNPLLHCMELIRTSYFYEFDSPYGSWTYAAGWSFGVLAIGLASHRGFRRMVYKN